MSWTAGTGGTGWAHLDTQLSDVQPLIEVSLSGGAGHPRVSPPRQQGKQNMRVQSTRARLGIEGSRYHSFYLCVLKILF